MGEAGLDAASVRLLLELLRVFPQFASAPYDPFVSAAEAAALGAMKMELDELCAASDVLSIHAPDLPSTRNLIGAIQLAALRTGATVINTARGRPLDHEALFAELEAGRLYAVLDVTEPEPLPDGSVLRNLPTVCLTPHLAGSEGTELARLIEYATDEISPMVRERAGSQRDHKGERRPPSVTRAVQMPGVLA